MYVEIQFNGIFQLRKFFQRQIFSNFFSTLNYIQKALQKDNNYLSLSEIPLIEYVEKVSTKIYQPSSVFESRTF